MPNNSDVISTETALTSENNATLKYILQQDLLYCPKYGVCSYSRPSNLVLRSCCESCSCQPSCHYLDNCCPDILKVTLNQHSNRSGEAYEKMRCIHPQLMEYLSSDVDYINQFLMISRCDDTTYTDTVLKCERQDWDPTDLTMDILLPVTIGGDAFKNKYCAMCNNANLTEAIIWRAEVRCPTSKSITGNSASNLIQNLLTRRTCNLIFAPRTQSAQCNIGLVRKCNVTGKWMQYDAFVERACLSYTHVYRGVYRNIFCFMCNGEDGLYMQCSGVDIKGKESILLGSFNALIEYNPMTSQEQDDAIVDTRCPSNEIYDDNQKSCLKLHCTDPLAVSGMECKSVYEPKLYIFDMYFLIQSDPESESNFHSYIGDNLEILFEVFDNIINETDQAKLCERELLEENNRFQKRSKWLVHLDLRGFYSHEFVESLLALDGKEHPIANFSMTIHFEMNESNIVWYRHRHLTRYNSNFCVFLPSVKLSRHLICPFVVVPRNDTFVRIDGTLCYTQYPSKCFGKFSFDCDKNSCKICADQLSSSSTAPSRNIQKENDFETLLSFSCSLISMLSLLVTIATFSLFSSLRSPPGLNTMALSISLLISHGLYSFGMFQTHIEALCIGLGILTHFSWLNSFTWMNVCSFHMYRVFGLIRFGISSKQRTFLKYVAYSILVPAFIITSHTLLSFYTSNTLGYGGHMCYISEFQMVLYFFAVPLGVGLSVNIILFLIVVVKTSRLPDLSKDMNIQRNTLIIYFKLTSLTGMTWLFGFLYQHTNVKELSYVHTVLNGIQGLYILIAFSFNARVRRLYKMSFISKRTSSKSRLKAEEATYAVEK
ncbi:hypothetical protein FSP39_012131 [Pinctada imbricata]|uniref:G-protein coupled receptors family 2 profile 2 domain-containing protein n=1 Tax=Pinctada imbricata TaxID=66713 RepID=A0AA88XYK5_PINIB|nr:hypothetical protein FSP39_012131 [Pinctada imbricata]